MDLMKRREFLQRAALGAAGSLLLSSNRVVAQKPDEKPQGRLLPYKIGMRQASLRNPQDPSKGMVGNIDTFKVVRDIPDITGVELQVTAGKPNLWDLSVACQYKAQAHRWGLMITSTAGVWGGGAWGPDSRQDLLRSLRTTEILGARIMLVAFFGKNAPNMADKQSYEPIVSILKEIAPRAEEAGVILGLENSLSPKDNKDLVDRVDHPAVKVYYDPENMYQFGHPDQAVPGIALLGPERITAVHVKNKGRVLTDAWRVDWTAAFRSLTEMRYDGWLIFESEHKNHQECKETTRQNIAFIKEHFSPPLG